MKENKRFFITGDTHRDFGKIEKFCQRFSVTKNDYMILLGDTGINYMGEGSDFDLMGRQLLQSLPLTFLLVRGNHEFRPEKLSNIRKVWLDDISAYCYEEPDYPNIKYLIDGKIILNKDPCLVLSGAFSPDKESRIKNNMLWFADEEMSAEEKIAITKMLDSEDNKFRFVFSHTCPYQFQPVHLFQNRFKSMFVGKKTEVFLQTVYHRLDMSVFETWFFGHFHSDEWINDKMRVVFNDIIELSFE